MRAIAADAHPHRARSAALSLRLPDRMENAFAHPFEIPIRLAQVVELARHSVLNVLVLAAAAFENQLHFDLVLLPLLEVNHRRFLAQVGAAIFPGERIDRIRAQLAALGRFRHGLPDGFLDRDLVDAHRSVNGEGRHAGVLADGAFVFGRHVDVRGDDVQRLRSPRVGQLGAKRLAHGFAHVRRQIGRGLGYEFSETFY